MRDMPDAAIVGDGRMGRALCTELDGGDIRVTAVYSRHKGRPAAGRLTPQAVSDAETIDADIILITTQDDEIANAAGSLVSKVVRPSIILHTSGSMSSDILADARAKGFAVGSMHPLVSVTDGESVNDIFRGVYFCVEGDPRAVEAAKLITGELGGEVFTIAAEKKALYHAAAVMTSGHTVALFAAAAEVLAECGLSGETAREILLPLLSSTAANLERAAPKDAITGPFARADIGTVERDLDALIADADADAKKLFLILGERSLRLALERGIDRDAAEKLADAINIARSRSEC